MVELRIRLPWSGRGSGGRRRRSVVGLARRGRRQLLLLGFPESALIFFYISSVGLRVRVGSLFFLFDQLA